MTNTLPTDRPSVILDHVIPYDDVQPVFIVGSVRSGTSAIMNGLRRGVGIRGFNEGNFAKLMPELLDLVTKHFENEDYVGRPQMVMNLQPNLVANGIKNLFGAVFIGALGRGRWVDKTPGGSMVRACPLLLEIFPRARFIFCKRRGIENMLSRQRKFPAIPFVKHCRNWVDTMEQWQSVRDAVGDSKLEVDQRDMALDTAGVAARVSEFLELSAEESENFKTALTSVRMEQTRPAQDSDYIPLEETGWSAEEIDTFVDICGDVMRAYGYPLQIAGRFGDPKPFHFFVPVTNDFVERRNLPSGGRGLSAPDSRTLALYPNGTSQAPAAVSYRSIDMTLFRSFSSRIRMAGTVGRKGMFRFSIEQGADRSVVFCAERAVEGEDVDSWAITLPPLSGVHDVVLSNWIAGEENPQPSARATWIDPALTG